MLPFREKWIRCLCRMTNQVSLGQNVFLESTSCVKVSRSTFKSELSGLAKVRVW